jgi:hypothetical protein
MGQRKRAFGCARGAQKPERPLRVTRRWTIQGRAKVTVSLDCFVKLHIVDAAGMS